MDPNDIAIHEAAVPQVQWGYIEEHCAIYTKIECSEDHVTRAYGVLTVRHYDVADNANGLQHHGPNTYYDVISFSSNPNRSPRR